MQIYLPIAELSLDLFVVTGLGGAVGLLSGAFGIGGGFLLTPLLIFLGVPAPVAVATGANQILATSVSGTLAHWRRGNVDFAMGGVLLGGGLVGSTLGVWAFSVLKGIGQVDPLVSLAYVVLLSVIGGLMLLESLRAMRKRSRAATGNRAKRHQHFWLHALPLKLRFRQSKLYISVIAPVVIGLVVGLLAALLGVGGGFILVPAMIYLLGMPTSVTVGTSLLYILVVAANVTFLQAYQNQSVDVVLAGLLVIGGVAGTEIGAWIGARLRGEQIRGLLALLALGVSAKLFLDLVETPIDPYSLAVLWKE
ncbi:MAG: sulfite exporter TauE/SafE family protein [Rhodospirillaceae bacterium]|nr:sulfite exporter TauE/SafE family protein [Rhodospirillaceae bacterium]